MRLLPALSIAAVLAACGPCLSALGYPPEALREAPPEGLTLRALAVGQSAPDFELPATIGERWRLSARPEGNSAVLVFYRGHW